MGQFVWQNFVIRAIKPQGKIFRIQKQITKIFFLLGSTRALSLNWCAAQFPHYNSDPVDRLSQIREIKVAKHQWSRVDTWERQVDQQMNASESEFTDPYALCRGWVSHCEERQLHQLHQLEQHGHECTCINSSSSIELMYQASNAFFSRINIYNPSSQLDAPKDYSTTFFWKIQFKN